MHPKTPGVQAAAPPCSPPRARGRPGPRAARRGRTWGRPWARGRWAHRARRQCRNWMEWLERGRRGKLRRRRSWQPGGSARPRAGPSPARSGGARTTPGSAAQPPRTSTWGPGGCAAERGDSAHSCSEKLSAASKAASEAWGQERGGRGPRHTGTHPTRPHSPPGKRGVQEGLQSPTWALDTSLPLPKEILTLIPGLGDNSGVPAPHPSPSDPPAPAIPLPENTGVWAPFLTPLHPHSPLPSLGLPRHPSSLSQPLRSQAWIEPRHPGSQFPTP